MLVRQHASHHLRRHLLLPAGDHTAVAAVCSRCRACVCQQKFTLPTLSRAIASTSRCAMKPRAFANGLSADSCSPSRGLALAAAAVASACAAMGEAAAEELQLLAVCAAPSLCCSALHALLLPASWLSLTIALVAKRTAAVPAGLVQDGDLAMLQCLGVSSGPDSTAGGDDSWRKWASCSCCLAAVNCGKHTPQKVGASARYTNTDAVAHSRTARKSRYAANCAHAVQVHSVDSLTTSNQQHVFDWLV
jgi:hypothetical protein